MVSQDASKPKKGTISKPEIRADQKLALRYFRSWIFKECCPRDPEVTMWNWWDKQFCSCVKSPSVAPMPTAQSPLLWWSQQSQRWVPHGGTPTRTCEEPIFFSIRPSFSFVKWLCRVYPNREARWVGGPQMGCLGHGLKSADYIGPENVQNRTENSPGSLRRNREGTSRRPATK